MSQLIEEKYEQVRTLINLGKERGYLLYDEVNDLLPPEVHSSEEIDSVLSTFERNGIGLFEDAFTAKARVQLAMATIWKWLTSSRRKMLSLATASSI